MGIADLHSPRLLSVLLLAPILVAAPARGEAPIAVALDACARGDAKAIREWIAQGGDPDQAGDGGWTPLCLAAVRGHAQVVEVLLNNPLRRADAGKPFAPSGALPIHMAGHSGSVETAALLLAARPKDIDAAWLLNGHTLLLQAAFYGHVELAAFALKRGANPTATTVRGLTAADFARQFDNQALLAVLSGHEVSEKRKRAYYNALLGRIREPVPRGQEESQRQSDALASLIETSLQRASREPDQLEPLASAIALKLVGVDPNRLAGDLRQPPLVVTVTGNNEAPHPETAAALRLRVALMLLDQGASPLAYERHPMGANAIIRASVFGHLEILKQMGSRISAAELAGALNERPAVNGLTAMHDAVLRASTASESRLPQYLEQIRWEVACGARSDIEDFAGRTQRQYAESIADAARRQSVQEALQPIAATPQWHHVAFAVNDLEAASRWYGEVFGFAALGVPIVAEPGDTPTWRRAATLFGSGIAQVRIQRLRVASVPSPQVLELFELRPLAPPRPNPRSGALHASLIVGDVETVAERIAARGGRILDRASIGGITIIFCADPNGNTLELASAAW